MYAQYIHSVQRTLSAFKNRVPEKTALTRSEYY